MLRVDQLKVHGLQPVTFRLNEGEILAVRGPSGSGKTLLLRALADLDPAEGIVLLGGLERLEEGASSWRQKVRYVAAEPAWWSDTVEDHFKDPAWLSRNLRQLALPDDITTRSIERLSTGERQRLGLLRALEGGPKVLLLDEPTASLDDESRAFAEELIRYHALAGACIILVTHDEAQARRLATRQLVLEDGKAVEGPIEKNRMAS